MRELLEMRTDHNLDILCFIEHIGAAMILFEEDLIDVRVVRFFKVFFVEGIYTSLTIIPNV